MVIAVIVLVLTNLATLAVVARLLLRTLDHPGPSGTVAAALDGSPAPPELSTTATRRVISIEILNPIALAGTRGRLAGLAGLLAPGITTRVVHDQAIRTVRRVLLDEGVMAQVRLHTITARPSAPAVVIDERGPDLGTGDQLS